MKKKPITCATCSIKGYSKDICRLHFKSITHRKDCPQNQCSFKNFSKQAVIGAGIGLTGALAGIAVLPFFGAKAILGHTLAFKLSGAGGAVGAGANVVKHKKKNCLKQTKTKKRSLLLPKSLRYTEEYDG